MRFSVYDYGISDEDDGSLDTSVPSQVAYAVSIHKAQGLECNSVKIVVTDANEDDVTRSIFFTAVTRVRGSLTIFRTPETQAAGCAQESSAGFEPALPPPEGALLSVVNPGHSSISGRQLSTSGHIRDSCVGRRGPVDLVCGRAQRDAVDCRVRGARVR